jgi:hypothetical protein
MRAPSSSGPGETSRGNRLRAKERIGEAGLDVFDGAATRLSGAQLLKLERFLYPLGISHSDRLTRSGYTSLAPSDLSAEFAKRFRS